MELLIAALRQFRDRRDWAKFHSPKNLAISISIEAAELLEIFQWDADTDKLSANDKSNIAAEASDVLLYTLMLFDRLGLDPVEEAFKKIEFNERRYPVEEVFGLAGRQLKKR